MNNNSSTRCPFPLLDLVEVSPVGEAGVVGFFGGPVVGGHLGGVTGPLVF